MITIDLKIARRYILGKQGLWPGRRWQGLAGTEQAMSEIEYLQLDPLQIITRSQDIQLHSRVYDYQPGMWEEVTYGQRKFFDWGGWLATRPMSELPYWRCVMRREREGNVDCDPKVRKNGEKYRETVAEMRSILAEKGIVTNRDFEMAKRSRTENYRGRKDSAVALYHLWRTGEIMTHHRDNFERVYGLTDLVAPADLLFEAEDNAVDRFLIKKEISFLGLSRLQRTSDAFLRGVPFSRKKELVNSLLNDGEIFEVKVEGWKPIHYALADDRQLLDTLISGSIPAEWAPLGATTADEALFLAPLDPVCARGRAKILFDFDYVWEVYKPKEKRKYGYYTLPILWNECLVGRFDSKYDNNTKTFIILGFWLEDEELGTDESFTQAFSASFCRFARFLGATQIELRGIDYNQLQQVVSDAFISEQANR